ncbi:MAG: DUF4340 domain-containing protein [Kiritimatiellia bacterium]
MKRNKLIGLAAAALVLSVAAYMTSSSRKVKTPSCLGKPVLPGLDLSRIRKIELKDKNDQTLKLESSDSGWKITSHFDYPADIPIIRKQLLKIKELRIGQKADAEKVTDATVLDMQDKTGRSIATLRLGDEHLGKARGQMTQYSGGSFPDGRYVAPGGDEKAYLVKEPLSSFTPDVKNWTDTEIVDISSSDVNGIALIKGDEVCTLSKKEGSWTVAGLNTNEEFDTSSSYSLESALSSLSFTDLGDPAMSDSASGISTGAFYKVTLKNGESYTASLGNTTEGSSDRYMKIAASFTPQGTNETVNTAARTKIENFNEKTSEWLYVIPSHKAESMLKTRSDLVKNKEEQEENK